MTTYWLLGEKGVDNATLATPPVVPSIVQPPSASFQVEDEKKNGDAPKAAAPPMAPPPTVITTTPKEDEVNENYKNCPEKEPLCPQPLTGNGSTHAI